MALNLDFGPQGTGKDPMSPANANAIVAAINDSGIGGVCKAISHEDLNTICDSKTGFYAGTDLTNAPNNNKTIWFMILHISMTEKYCHQIAFNASSGMKYERHCANGNWSEWS